MLIWRDCLTPMKPAHHGPWGLFTNSSQDLPGFCQRVGTNVEHRAVGCKEQPTKEGQVVISEG
jgi:hypothetical protein